MALHLSGNDEADALLSTDPLALLVGMVLDQQVPLEWAFSAPAELKQRLGGRLDAKKMAAMDPDAFAEVFLRKPALHRYPASMAKRVHDLVVLIVDEYGERADNVWAGAKDASELLRRLKKLPGFGDQKARIFLALLGKQLGVRPTDWEQVSAPYGEEGSLRSVADIVDTASLERVRASKQAAKQAARAAAAAQGTETSARKAAPAVKRAPAKETRKAPRSTSAGATKNETNKTTRKAPAGAAHK